MSKGLTHQKSHNKQSGKKIREIIYAEKNSDEMYGEVIQALGQCRFKIKLLLTNQEIVAKVRGALKLGKRKPNKQHIYPKSTVLLLKDGEHYHIMHCYSDDHLKQLKKAGEITENINITDINNVIFEDEEVTKSNDIVINLDEI